ncbi:ATP-binding protein [Scleromatobacter humisilvae]|uniref:histidine kinase n=1 Tax=Scleromatobacter humisilvae TaxID=2897159 RepID=A0A9X1YNU8_9BURK|nr:ATP-binding protein [Scleromatobacter humisilvae]MCK9689247.1 response regulator [Scleromatobacter humisilvae]
MTDAALASATTPPAPQRVVKVRRDYNSWVAQESLEDYALRYTPQSFRKWSELRVANTAFGAASFLVLEAVGATLLVQDGFVNAFWAILATGLIIALAGWPIAVYAARHGLDMDLLTRGAGFGYLGSTITSLIYASFTFIFFALEAAVMAYALDLAFDIPPAWGYLVCAVVVLPLVTHGVTAIGRLQVWTQPLWIAMLVLPYVFVFRAHPHALAGLWAYAGEDGRGGRFDVLKFGSAMTVGIALMTQMGEQADYLRFMPARTAQNRRRWWWGVAIGGPGWVLPGVLKMLGGALLAWIAIGQSVPLDRAVDPNQMYLAAWDTVFSRPGMAVAATAAFVVLSQLKINVTNAYAGSLAWSNFFARLTHSHPGRVVWVAFNTAIALMLMELDVFTVLGKVLGLYANLAISWLMAVVADLVVNKPLGLSPRGIEFRRAYLYDVNPVGVGAMGAASVLSIAAHLGAFGPLAQAFSALIALVTAFIASPLIAWATKGRYYVARRVDEAPVKFFEAGATQRYRALRCSICEREYEGPDMSHCPAYQGPICSLCCSLDARCGDLCKPDARLATQARDTVHALLPRRLWPAMDGGLGGWLALMLPVSLLLAGVCALLYQQELRVLGNAAPEASAALRQSVIGVFAMLLLASGVVGWWAVLTRQSRRVAQEESNRQTQALGEQTVRLTQEIESHRQTDAELQRAKAAADAANQAKSRYISTLSHELRTPLNSVIGYAQLLDDDPALPAHRRQAVSVIRRGGEHLLSLIEGTLDLARIESGKVSLATATVHFREAVDQLADLFELQAGAKGLRFVRDFDPALPHWVRADERRLRQILINVIGNAVKFTDRGTVTLRIRHEREMAYFDIEDTGPGIADKDLERIFEPFARGAARVGAGDGTGLGLTIAKMLTDLMGGEMSVHSTPGAGTRFRIVLFLAEQRAGAPVAVTEARRRSGYAGARRSVLVVDNEEVDRELLRQLLEPIGFGVRQAPSGEAALQLLGDGARPDAILMDLAMPGIDGWETIRRLRDQGLSDAPVAIVSANAFDRRLDNDLGIVARDYVLKPVRGEELLDWLGHALRLQWRDEPAAAMAAPAVETAPAAAALPERTSLQALAEQVRVGYPRGIHRWLDHIDANEPACADFTRRLRGLASRFQLDAMAADIAQALQLREAPHG